MELENAAALLDPAPQPLEMGVQRLSSGQLHIAARTDMPGCTGRMFAWWFRFAPDSQAYTWWHPRDHVSSSWRETSPLTHIGSTHIVEERLGDADGIRALQLHFIDPAEIFGAEAVEDAMARGDISAIVSATVGMGPEPPRDAKGRPIGSRMAHIARDTSYGMVLRSRFWLGAGTDLTPEALVEMIPDATGLGLMQHAHTEYKYLARFLPSLYVGENRDHEEVALPW